MGSIFNQKSTLVLRTEDLTVGTTTNIGSCDALNNNFTWNNINMKQILGREYDNYDDFNISLNLVTAGFGSVVYGADAGDRLVNFNMSGLTFKNNCYNVATQSNQQSVNLYSYLFSNSTTTGATSTLNVDSNSFTFTKDELVNISINYTRTFKNSSGNYTIVQNPTANSIYPPVCFTFKITGIPKEVEKKLIDFNK